MEPSAWLDREEYPFGLRVLPLAMGRLHYVDEGEGRPVVMVHGTPTWSFLYRHLIKGLSPAYRCIAPDHIGFGLSDKPPDWSYRPEDHAANLEALVERLGLRDITLVVEDFGGPIGLSYALRHPDNVRSLVLSNTWMWSLAGDPHFARFGRVAAGPIGRFLYTRLNFSPRVMLPLATKRKARLTRAVHRHYLAPFRTAEERRGPWVLARELIGSSPWYDRLLQERARIRDLPALVLWGMKDPAFRLTELRRWREVLTRATVIKLGGVGHFPHEECGSELVPEIRQFLDA